MTYQTFVRKLGDMNLRVTYHAECPRISGEAVEHYKGAERKVMASHVSEQSVFSKVQLYQRALAGAAELVAGYGDEFLPAYTRMEQALKEAQELQNTRERALRMASCGSLFTKFN